MNAIFALLLLLPSLLFAAAPGDMQPGKWVQINQTSGAGTTLNSVGHSPAPGGALRQIMDAWSGGAFATSLGQRGSLLVHGGGHEDYFGNEIYAFDVATGRWSKLYSPGSSCDVPTSTMNSPTNAPCASHTYDTLEFAPSTNEFIKVGSTSDDYSTTGTSRVKAYNVLTNQWSQPGFVPGQSTSPGDDFEGSTTAWDSVRNLVWWHGTWRSSTPRLVSFNPATDTFTPHNSAADGNMKIDSAMAFAPDLNALVIVEGRNDSDGQSEQIHVIDVSGTPVRYTVPFSGVSDLPSQIGFDYDPIARKFVGYAGGTSVYTLTPPANWASTKSGTWVWATVAAGSGSANPGTAADNGTWGRFRYAPALCAFVVANDITGGVYAYQTATGGTGCGGTPSDPPPAVTLTANPTTINSGQSSTLTWLVSNVSSCTASGGWSGSKSTSGSQEAVSPTSSTTYTLTCNGIGTEAATQAASTATVTVQTAGGGSDFATRCAAAGVRVCEDWDTTSDFTPQSAGGNLWPAYDGTIRAVRDTTIKSSGASSIRFNIPSNADDNAAGYYLVFFTADGVEGFGPGDTLWMQMRMRFDANYVNTSWNAYGGDGTKQWILTRWPGSSCASYQQVQEKLYGYDFPFMHASCGQERMEYALPGNDFQMHQGDDADCRYRDQAACDKYPINTWTTFTYKLTLVDMDSPVNRIEGWMQPDGGPKRKWLDFPVWKLQSENSGDRFNVLHLTQYMSGKNPALASPLATVWYDDLIISTQQIADPGGGSVTPAPTVNIAVTPGTIPSGGSASIDWNTANATSCTGSGGWSGSIPTSGSQSTGTLTASQTYTLSCTGTGGTTQASASVTVQAAAPTVSLSATTPVQAGQGSLLTWSSTGTSGATPCTATGGWTGSKTPSGSQFSNALSSTTSFGLSCTGPGGTGFAPAVEVQVVTTPPTITLTASPSGTLAYGASTVISWTTQNATACGWAQGFTPGSSAPTSGSLSTGPLTATTTYEMACTNSGSAVTAQLTVTVNAAPNPVITGFTAEPSTIDSGDSAALAWVSLNTTSCSLDNGIGSVGTSEISGLDTGALTETTAYTLTCTGAGGTTARSTTVTVQASAAPVVGIVAAAPEVAPGGSTTLYWTTLNASSCTASGSWSGSKATAGNESTGALTAPATYVLACTGPGGTTQASANVAITALPAVTVDVVASPNPIDEGESSTLNWTVANATSCTASGGWSGSKSVTGGSEPVSPTAEQTSYTLLCTGASGSASDTETVLVVFDVDPPPALNFAANPTQGASGFSTELSWSSVHADTCTASGGWSGSKATSGTQTISAITAATAFTLDCSGDGGAVSQSVNVVVLADDDPLATISATPSTIPSGQQAEIVWSCADSTSATASDGAGEWGGSLPLSGSRLTGPLTASTDFTVTCSDGVDEDEATVTVTVTTAVSMTLSASPVRVPFGDSATLTWTTEGSLNTCFWNEGFDTGRVAAADGTRSTGALTKDKLFRMTCADSSTFTSADPITLTESVVVKINPGTIPRSRRPRCRLWWCR